MAFLRWLGLSIGFMAGIGSVGLTLMAIASGLWELAAISGAVVVAAYAAFERWGDRI